MRDQPGGAGDRQCAGQRDRCAFRAPAADARPHLRRPERGQMNRTPLEAAVTLVVQTRALVGQDHAFGEWQARISAAVAEHPGFLEQSVMPPNPPAQADWVILQRFTTADAAIAWLRSDRRQKLLAEVQHVLVGVDDVHLLRDPAAGVMPAPVSAVITTRVKPGQEAA